MVHRPSELVKSCAAKVISVANQRVIQKQTIPVISKGEPDLQVVCVDVCVEEEMSVVLSELLLDFSALEI